MLRDAPLVAFVATADLPAARNFYGDVLGLALVEDGAFGCVFDAAGTRLRVTPVTAVVPAPNTVVGWEVPDAHATVEALAAVGVAVERFDGLDQDTAGVWTTPSGDRVAWFCDPDGNRLSITGPGADRSAGGVGPSTPGTGQVS